MKIGHEFLAAQRNMVDGSLYTQSGFHLFSPGLKMENEAARRDAGSRIEAAKPVRPAMGERLPLVQRSGGIKVEMQGAAEEFSLAEEIAKHLVKGRHPRFMDTLDAVKRFYLQQICPDQPTGPAPCRYVVGGKDNHRSQCLMGLVVLIRRSPPSNCKLKKERRVIHENR
jgi:hypothetical protein